MDDYKHIDNKHQIENLYRLIRRIRFFEEELSVLFGEGEVYGTAHTCIGQEAVAVGCLYDLQVEDFVKPTPPQIQKVMKYFDLGIKLEIILNSC